MTRTSTLEAGGTYVALGVGTLAELLDACEGRGADDLWLPSEALEPLGLPAELGAGTTPHPWLRGLDAAGWETRTRGLAAHAYYYRKGARGGIDLNVPAWSDPEAASPFAGLPAGQLWHEARRLREATHGLVTWQGRATLTSDALIRRTTRGLVASPLPPPVLKGRGGELPHAWTAGPGTLDGGNPRLRAPRSCFAYDLNLAYLNGASSLALGCGDMVPAEWDVTQRPGWWEVEPPGWRTDTLPAPWSERGRRRPGQTVWVTTPTAKALSEWGGLIRGGWTFPESHRYLERWYRVLRDARAALMGEGGAAYQAVKQIAQHGLGRLGSLRRRLEDRDPLYQPYWREAVVAEMRVRLLRRLAKLRRYPIAVDVDCAYFLTNAANPWTFAEWAGLPLGDGLGQFKYAGRCTGRIARDALEVGGSRALVTLREATNE